MSVTISLFIFILLFILHSLNTLGCTSYKALSRMRVWSTMRRYHSLPHLLWNIVLSLYPKSARPFKHELSLASASCDEYQYILHEANACHHFLDWTLTSAGNKPDLMSRLKNYYEQKNAMSMEMAKQKKMDDERAQNALTPIDRESDLAKREAEMREVRLLVMYLN